MSEISKKLVIPSEEYYIGLDIGTTSVGWALTDDKYNIQKFNEKKTWGVRLFDEANTANYRREKRSSRRRLHRRRVRLNYLKELFRPEIEKIDPNFFKRLENSYLYVNDDNESGTRIDFAKGNDIKLCSKTKRLHLFEGSGITDKQYYKDFPTIYHLRSALINGKCPRIFCNEKGDYETEFDQIPTYNLYDPRLVFLALHSLLKSRGSFLYDIENLGKYVEGNDFEVNLNNVASSLLLKFKKELNIVDLKKLYNNQLLQDGFDKNGSLIKVAIKTTNDKIKCFKQLVEVDDNSEDGENNTFNERKKLFYEIIKLSFGGTKSFDENNDDESLLFGLNDKVTIDYADEKYEENLKKIRSISEQTANAIESSYKIYIWAKLSDILQDQSYLCMGKVKIYNKHKTDLQCLKNAIREILKYDEEKDEKFKRIFDKRQGEFTYDTYVHHGKKSEEETPLKSFEKHIKNVLGKRDGNYIFEEYKKANDYLMSEFKDGTFLPVLRSLDNLAIPNVVIRSEYEKILEMTKINGLDFLNDKYGDKSKFQNDGSGKTPYEKIRSLISFRIPYYIGPLAYARDIKDEDDVQKWIVRKEGCKNREIMPWIFDDAIDKSETRKKFIKRMVSNCTYLKGCKALPKNSICLQKQQVLEELNNLQITIKGRDLPKNSSEAIQLKQYIFKNVFEILKAPTVKRVKATIANYFRNKGENVKERDIDFIVGGEDTIKFNSSYSSYIELKDIPLSVDEKEKLIELYTIFGSDSKNAREEAETAKEYDFYRVLSEDQKSIINNALSNMNGWGRYSKEFLIDLTVRDSQTNVSKNILSWLWDTNYNIMQLKSMKGTKENFDDKIQEFNNGREEQKHLLSLKYSDIDELFVPVNVKRAIWQSVRIVKELVKIVGYSPKKIFIETTRSVGEKGKTKKSRYVQLNEKYEAVKRQAKSIENELQLLDIKFDKLTEKLNDENNRTRINREHLYLYFMQCGKDMYTGEDLDLKKVIIGTNDYDADHIYPRSLTNDDSVIDNKVLVDKNLNGKKNKNTLKGGGIITDPVRVKVLWKFLYDKEFISKEKYRRLLYSLEHKEFEYSELEGFQNRQLVETSQSTKAVMNLLQDCSWGNKQTEIVSVKAHLVSEFRNKNMMYKSRDINDMHHAKDAYLNIVVGNVYNTEFTHKYWRNVFNDSIADDKSYNISSKIYDKTIFDNSGNIVWGKKSLSTVETEMSKNDALLTRMQTTGKGELFDATVYSEIKTTIKNINSVTSIKDSDVHYGFYNKQSSAFFCLVESLDKKGKVKLSIECIPVWFYNKNKTHNKFDIVKKYCELPQNRGGLEMKIVDVVVPYIRIKALLNFINGNEFARGYISGRTGSHLSFVISDMLDLKEMESYAVQICKFIEKQKANSDLTIDEFNFRKPLDNEETSNYRDIKRPKIDSTMNIKFYEKLIEIHKEPQFINKPSSQLKKLLEPQKDKFTELSVENQAVVLYQFVQYLNGETGDFRLIDGVKEGGVFRFASNINETIQIVNQSVTGLYENSITISLDDLKNKGNTDGQ